jgi:transposase InsO family protein
MRSRITQTTAWSSRSTARTCRWRRVVELLDQHPWADRQQLALAIFEWIEAWYNPRHRHSYCSMLSPADYEAAHTAAATAA